MSTGADIAEIALLEGLLRIPSPSGQEQAAVQWLVEQMAARGLEAWVDAAGNAVGALGTGHPTTVLLGHIDTVPGVIPVRREADRLYGRGAVDAKGPLAAFVCAMARLRAAGGVPGRIVVIGCVEEEAPSSRGAHHAAQCYRPDFCIVGEPSRWDRVTLGYKGTLRVRARLRQPCAHSAHARRTATEAIVELWCRLQEHAAQHNAGRARAFDQLQPTLLGIHSQSDGLHEEATAEINLRLPPDLPPEAVAARLAQFDPAIHIEVLGATPAFQAPRGNPVAHALTQAIRRQGAQPALVLKTGTADMNIVGPAWGCPTVAYGPGDAALDHTPDEHIELADYASAIAVLAQALSHLQRRA